MASTSNSQSLASEATAHLAQAEKRVATAPETLAARARPVERICVVGGGTMGAGIVVACLDAGFQVTMIERDEPSLSTGRTRVAKIYEAQVAKGRIDRDAMARLLGNFKGSFEYAAAADAELVIEAVFEDMDAKKAVFAQLDRHCKPGAVLATNTSYLDIEELASSIGRPEDVIGLHFFSPANIMKLLEVVVPRRASADAVATAFAVAARLRKMAVRAGVCDGFIGNRILAAYRLGNECMVEDGASPYQIDAALRDFGYPMGPFQVSDLSGGDIAWAARRRRAATRDPRQRYVHIPDRLCERNWLGQKTGRGWYRYPEGSRTGVPDPEVEALIEHERALAGRMPRTFTDDEIVRRFLAALINEGANVLEQKIALRPSDIDVVFTSGYGFPRERGGPMYHADQVGLDRVLADIRQFEKEDSFFWRPSPLLVELVDKGRRFESLNGS